MRYLSLAEAVLVAEAVTGLDSKTLTLSSRMALLDSALHAPRAGFGDQDFYPTLPEKAAVLAVRIALNHPLPDGNKRLAWASMNVFVEMNGFVIQTSEDDAVELMLGVAAGSIDEAHVVEWLGTHLTPRE